MFLVESDNLLQIVPEQSHSHGSFRGRESLAKLNIKLIEQVLEFSRRLEHVLVVDSSGEAS